MCESAEERQLSCYILNEFIHFGSYLLTFSDDEFPSTIIKFTL